MKYKCCEIFKIEGYGKHHKTCCLDNLSILDQQFGKIIEENDVVRSLYDDLFNDGKEPSKLSMFTDEAKETGMALLEIAFVNRGRFAVEQKVALARCHGLIKSDIIKTRVHRAVNKELDVALDLLGKINRDEATAMKEMVEKCRKCKLENFTDFEDEGEQSDTEISDESDDVDNGDFGEIDVENNVHVIMPDI